MERERGRGGRERDGWDRVEENGEREMDERVQEWCESAREDREEKVDVDV